MQGYDDTFFDYVSAGATRSARHLLPALAPTLKPDSVLDAGCGRGAWLAVWQELGVPCLQGIDGSYVDRSKLLCPAECFMSHDLARPFDLGRRFDLVQSLEVAEHLPEASARDFVASLVRHGDRILFSAAPRGQGGDHHVNEQSYEYWRRLFAEQRYVPFDFIRPQVAGMREIEPWYRYNPILYVAAEQVSGLPEAVRLSRVDEGAIIKDVSPWSYQLRKKVLGCLPVPVMTRLAKFKERSVGRRARAEGMR